MSEQIRNRSQAWAPSGATSGDRSVLLGVYRGGAPTGPANVAAYESWLGRKVDITHDFAATDTWANIQAAGWQYGTWTGKPRQHLYSVPMFPSDGSTLAAGAAGLYDSHWTTFGQSLASNGLTGWLIRLGWEFNGGWYAYAASGKVPDFIAYWQRIVRLVRAVPGCANVRFVWCPVYGYQQFDSFTAYPGDAYVDYCGVDIYDEAYGGVPTWAADPVARWNHFWYDDHMLQAHINFAATHKKPFCLPEWGMNIRTDGAGGGDNSYFIQKMHDVIVNPANNVAFHSYFDVDVSDGKHLLSTAGTSSFPIAAAQYLSLFGG